MATKESSYKKLGRLMIEEYDTAVALSCRIAELEGLVPLTHEWAMRAVEVYEQERDRLHPRV